MERHEAELGRIMRTHEYGNGNEQADKVNETTFFILFHFSLCCSPFPLPKFLSLSRIFVSLPSFVLLSSLSSSFCPFVTNCCISLQSLHTFNCVLRMYSTFPVFVQIFMLHPFTKLFSYTEFQKSFPLALHSQTKPH